MAYFIGTPKWRFSYQKFQLDILFHYNENNNINNNNKAIVDSRRRSRCTICCHYIQRQSRTARRLRLWRIHWKLYLLQQGAICVLQLADATVETPFAKTWRHPQNRKYKTFSVITEEDRAIVNMYRKFRKVLSRAVFEVCEGTDTHTYKHTCRYTQWSVKDLRSGNSVFSAGPWLSARVSLRHPRGQGAVDAECWCEWIFDAIFAFVFLDPY